MRNFQKPLLLCGTAALLTFTALTGCSTWGERHDGRSTGRVIDDKTIAADIEKKLQSEPVYKFDNVEVRTFNGVAQLSGFVDTPEQKQRAGELAQTVPGVAQVVNNITLKPQVTPAGRSSGTQPPPSTPPPTPNNP